MGRKHEKARGKDKERKGSATTDSQGLPSVHGCPIPEPVDCFVDARLERECDDDVLMECTNASCPFVGIPVHIECFRALEDHLVRVMSTMGSARGWTDGQRRVNLWEKKGLSLVAKVCRCRCGAGTTRRDELALYKQMQRHRQEEEAAVEATPGGHKKKTGKTKALPKLNFAPIKGLIHTHEDRERKDHKGGRSGRSRINGRQRELSTSSMSSSGAQYGYRYDADGHRESLTYMPDSRALSVMSGNVADHDDTLSVCSRSDPFQEPVELVPAPLPGRLLRSYAAAIKQEETGGSHITFVDSTPLSIRTDVNSLADSGIEMMKSGSSTGSDGYDDKEMASPSAAREMFLTETPKTSRTAKHRNVVSTVHMTPSPSPVSVTKVDFPEVSDSFADPEIGDVAEWDMFVGSTFGLGECILANAFLPRLFF